MPIDLRASKMDWVEAISGYSREWQLSSGSRAYPSSCSSPRFWGYSISSIFIRDKEKGFAFGTFIAFTVVVWSLLGAEKILDFIPYL